MHSLPEFRLESYFSRWEFRAQYNLAASDSETWSISELLGLANTSELAAWQGLRLGYTQTFGDPQLREELAATYSNIDAANVLCFSGGEEGLFAAFHCILSPDDHAVVVVPSYQSAEALPRRICRVTGVALRADDSWRLDLDELVDAIVPETRMLVINFPNNPTGASVTAAQLEDIVSIARERGIYLLSDEAYRGLERPGAKPLPQVADLYDRGLSLGVLSKAYGLPGLRVGWIACRDRDIIRQMERFKHYLSICGSAPSEVLARIAVRERLRLWERNTRLLTQNLSYAQRFFENHATLFDWLPPDGGCVTYPRYLGLDGVEAFCANAVEAAGVLLLPASVFHSDLAPLPSDRFRLGLGRANFADALAELSRFLSASRDIVQPDRAVLA
jgi:aspartate/methionine/tyrosine aminotransferase